MIRILILCILLFASTAFAGWSPIGPYGGEIASISVAKDGVYIGTEGGGVFFSADGGKNWEGRRKGLEDAFVESLTEAKGDFVRGDKGRDIQEQGWKGMGDSPFSPEGLRC